MIVGLEGRQPGDDIWRQQCADNFKPGEIQPGGAAGLAATLAAGRSGARVIVADEDFAFGGRLLSDAAEIDGGPAADWVARALQELAALPNVRLMRRTTVFGVYDGGAYGAVERVNDHVARVPDHEPRQRGWRIFAKRAVLAAGAVERPLVFGGNEEEQRHYNLMKEAGFLAAGK